MYVLKITSPRRRGADYVSGNAFVTDPDYADTYELWSYGGFAAALQIREFLSFDDHIDLVPQ